MRVPDSSVDGRYDLAGWYLVRRVLALKRTLPTPTPSLLDLGMGRGRDLTYFARHGFRAFGIDVSPLGLERARRRATRLGVPIHTTRADMRSYRVPRPFDVVYSSCALNHLPRRVRQSRLKYFKSATTRGGIHALNAFVLPSGHGPEPELDPGESYYRSGELASYYRDWDGIEERALEFDCRFGDRPHQHSVDALLARRPR